MSSAHRFISLASLLFFLGCFNTFAADTPSNEAWLKNVKGIAEKLAPLDATAIENVVKDLKMWDPERSSWLGKIPARVWDVLSNDEYLAGIIVAQVFGYIWEPANDSLYYPISSLARKFQAFTVLAQNCWKNPSISFNRSTFPKRELLKLAAALVAHMTAIGFYESYFMCNDYARHWDYAGVCGISGLLGMTSIAFTAMLAYMAVEGDYFDVALRSLKRKYKKQKNFAQLAVVQTMIAYRAKRLVKDKND